MRVCKLRPRRFHNEANHRVGRRVRYDSRAQAKVRRKIRDNYGNNGLG